MPNIGVRLIEIIRNLKSDAVPRPPRTENESDDIGEVPEENNENLNFANHQEEEFTEPNENKKDFKNPKYKKPTFGTGKKSSPKKNKHRYEEGDYDTGHSNNIVNTHASGPVVTIVNSKNVHCGPTNTYYMGSNNNSNMKNDDSDEEIGKCNLITVLLEAKTKPDHEYIDYISKNLGKNWHGFFRTLGFTKGRIETVEIDEFRNGVSEARYKLLRDWVWNDNDGTLGRLATLLWEYGERQVVKELAILYKTNRNV